jgi:hypothetical protein
MEKENLMGLLERKEYKSKVKRVINDRVSRLSDGVYLDCCLL